ncbi:PREDICTED: uncharacterized protein LOC103320155 [Prunus mume]|uniref:Uncharacterized protein LOC103320155 n=1 Tax=Prunus mume TaxID=102107 RepID=A0ABM0N5W6_PRUMU|nr:PREDICTED: uncharacterized protein LOC103320155 [Prunus mume]
MNPSTTSPNTNIHVDFPNSHPNEDQNQPNTPLLHQCSDELRNFRVSLKWWTLDHSSCLGKFISYFTFIFLTILVPILAAFSLKSPSEDPISFNKLVQLPQSGLAAIGFITLSSFFRKYGLRQLLFLDGLGDDTCFVRRGYTRELDKAFKCLAYILLPSFFIELAHKIIFFCTVKISLLHISSSVPLNSIMFVLVLASWVYRTGVFLLVCVLFRLTCELQILRFQGLHKLFEGRESKSSFIFQEHIRIRKQLWVTSHRYRFFIIGCTFVVTVSQFGALLLVLASKTKKTFLNSGDLVVCSAVELSGFFLCLMEAARITHRAQGISAIATRWHMLLTCPSAALDQQCKKQQSSEADGCCGETDSEFSSNVLTSVSPQEPSSFQTRQALVAYLGHNSGGITLFGFPLDRGLLHTLFAFEFSLVLWVLSKVVVLS